MSTEIKRSVCPYDCPDTCSLLVEVKDGKALSVQGDPDHPFTRGFLCTNITKKLFIQSAGLSHPYYEPVQRGRESSSQSPGTTRLRGLLTAGGRLSTSVVPKRSSPIPTPEPWE